MFICKTFELNFTLHPPKVQVFQVVKKTKDVGKEKGKEKMPPSLGGIKVEQVGHLHYSTPNLISWVKNFCINMQTIISNVAPIDCTICPFSIQEWRKYNDLPLSHAQKQQLFLLASYTVVAYPIRDPRSRIIIFGRFFLSQWTNSNFQDLRTALG